MKIGVLISGRGSNLQAIIDAVEKGEIQSKIGVVISNNPNAAGLERARKHHITHFVVNHKEFKDKNSYELEIVKLLQKHRVDLVCLAGYMRIVGEVLLKPFRNRMLNIHPALLPSFPGLHSQKQALDYGVKISGCTVHFVDEGCDTGPIILQSAVEVKDDDTEDTLSARILEQEHQLYPLAVKFFCEGKLKIEGRKVRII